MFSALIAPFIDGYPQVNSFKGGFVASRFDPGNDFGDGLLWGMRQRIPVPH